MNDSGHDCPVICKAKIRLAQLLGLTVREGVNSKSRSDCSQQQIIFFFFNFCTQCMHPKNLNLKNQSSQGNFACWQGIMRATKLSHASFNKLHIHKYTYISSSSIWNSSCLLERKITVYTLTCFAMPKSANLTRPFGSTRMFAPLISLKRKARYLSRKKNWGTAREY